MSNIEKDRHRPSLDISIALCEHFNVTLDWLILGKGESLCTLLLNQKSLMI
ncbi:MULTISPECIES: helix-turn-helix domain-containing protein [Paenibacillus]|uniref:helix-turn-helix domain-containing protein n=1 Tax=Paenibacillus TaxID=44249 RepID=UPI00359345B0